MHIPRDQDALTRPEMDQVNKADAAESKDIIKKKVKARGRQLAEKGEDACIKESRATSRWPKQSSLLKQKLRGKSRAASKSKQIWT